ncbi:MAG: LysR family transcriptional regulator [Alphaproteobacteria bacterium]|nr:LysR family transcriptional regulator [Alphaproteobacteria bacterium]
MIGKDGKLGPGKVALLEGIAAQGSIAKAAAAMKMSYRRAWLLVKATEELVGKPVVETAIGGAEGGGARLTKTGKAVVAAYREIEREAANGARASLEALAKLAKT